jgi:hypothetical protein
LETFEKYKKLKEREQACQQTLNEGRRWIFLWVGFMIAVPWIGKWTSLQSFTQFKFLFPLYLIGFWTLIRILKVEKTTDQEIVKCILEGIDLEKKHQIDSSYFTDFVNYFDLKAFAFVRTSPPMMLVFFLIPIFLENFSASQPIQKWSIYGATILGFLLLFFSLMIFVSTPYVTLLKKVGARASA